MFYLTHIKVVAKKRGRVLVVLVVLVALVALVTFITFLSFVTFLSFLTFFVVHNVFKATGVFAVSNFLSFFVMSLPKRRGVML